MGRREVRECEVQKSCVPLAVVELQYSSEGISPCSLYLQGHTDAHTYIYLVVHLSGI